MVLFFFSVGMEIAREVTLGELRGVRALATPALAAVGGLVVPAAIFLAFNATGPGAHAWGIVLSTDTAVLLGVLALVGPRCPDQLRVFLLALSIVDDIGAVTAIAMFYTADLQVVPLLVAGRVDAGPARAALRPLLAHPALRADRGGDLVRGADFRGAPERGRGGTRAAGDRLRDAGERHPASPGRRAQLLHRPDSDHGRAPRRR